MEDSVEATSRNNMIMHMEKTLNSSWFDRHDKKDDYCTITIS